MANAVRDPNEPLEPFKNVDFTILEGIQGRLIKKTKFAEPILGLEVLVGPYTGIVFSFTSFTMLPSNTGDGMVPTRYETAIHIVPDHLKGFTPDEAFDHFTSEVVVAWLSYLHMNDLAPLLKMSTGSIQ